MKTGVTGVPAKHPHPVEKNRVRVHPFKWRYRLIQWSHHRGYEAKARYKAGTSIGKRPAKIDHGCPKYCHEKEKL